MRSVCASSAGSLLRRSPRQSMKKFLARVKVFYGFGAAGLLWSSWWESVVSSMAKDDPEAHRLLTETAATREASRAEPDQAMPWRAFLRNGPMRALAYTHFCNNWCALPALCISSTPLSLSPRSSSMWQMLLAMLETSHGRGVRISEDGRHTLCASQSITALWQMLSAVNCTFMAVLCKRGG